MSEEEKPGPVSCQRCGRCCKADGNLWEGGASIKDIAKWIETRRYDILDWVDPVVDAFTHEIVFDIWINPRTHEYVNRCPWLQREKGSDLYDCMIYDVRPAACREWPSNVTDVQKIACPACRETVRVIEFSKKRPDES